MRFLHQDEHSPGEKHGLIRGCSAQRGNSQGSPADLHLSVGNQAMQALFRAGLVQAKLSGGTVHDAAEREAEAFAASVLPGPANRKLNHQANSPLRRPLVQDAPLGVPGIVGQVLRSSGQPLDPTTRAFFEPRLGQDLSKIRLHTDQEASESARSIHALAYTVGRDIAFAKDRYSPNTDEGKHLLAHELVHTVQQAAQGSSVVQRTPDLGVVGVHVVNGKTYAPIKGANVHIDQAGVSGPKSIDLVTDRNGDTTSIELEEGDYTITVTFWCCDRKTFTVHVDGNAANFITAEMQHCDCRVSSTDQDGGAVASSGATDADGGSASTAGGAV